MPKKTDVKKTDEVKKDSLINNGKCCRCVSRKYKKCHNKKSKKNGKYVARKFSCECFKYKD